MYCHHCGENVEYQVEIFEEQIKIDGENIDATFLYKETFCPECKGLLFVGNIHDENIAAERKAINEYFGIITENEIDVIASKYNVSKKYLGKLLDLEDWNLDSDESDLLKEIGESPEKFKRILEEGKRKIPKDVFERTLIMNKEK